MQFNNIAKRLTKDICLYIMSIIIKLHIATNRKEVCQMAETKISMSIDEASAYTGIGRNTMRQLIEWHKLPVLRIGRKIVVRRDALERFVALNEWEYSDRILERSVRRRFEKGSVYPELIEAWLKYGVLTEQELNEQLNKKR
jgi:excisionase family DNA binding protein